MIFFLIYYLLLLTKKGDVERNIGPHLVERVTERLHPVYVRTEKNDQVRKKLKAAAIEKSSIGGGTEMKGVGRSALVGIGKGWFTNTWVVRFLIGFLDWDVITVVTVSLLSVVFVIWLVGKFTSTLVFWGSVGVVLGRFGYWLIVE